MVLSLLGPVVLFLLSFSVVMNYRILPTSTTPYWLFGVLFFLSGFNVLFAYMAVEKQAVVLQKLQVGIFAVIVGISLFGVMIASIVDRQRVAPVWGVHDIILQVEAAVRYLIEGKNPYKETYFGTHMESFRYAEPGNENAVNPALHHFVMPPGYLLHHLPFSFVSLKTVGFFDARSVLVFCALGTAVLLYYWLQRKELSLLLISLVLLSPGLVDYLIEGRSDMIAFFWFLFSLVLLERKRFLLAAGVYAISLTMKQTVWFSLPFVAWGFWYLSRKNVKVLVAPAIAFVLVLLLVVGPFVAWDSRAFMESVVLYLSQGGPTGYPVSGYGFSMILYEAGIIQAARDYFPFIVLQLGAGFPVMFLFMRLIAKQFRFSLLLIGYTTTLFVMWYFSRYFNNSHVGYIAMMYAVAVCKLIDEKRYAS